jgi:hypothetical protein
MSQSVIFESFWRVAQWGLASRFGRKKPASISR